MIISLGILSIFQLTFIPGLIFSKAFKIHGFWENLILAFGLSQLFNYLFVVAATLLHIYTQTTVLILFGVEVILLFVLYFSNLKLSLNKTLDIERIKLFFNEYLGKITVKTEWKKKLISFIYYLVFIVAFICLTKYFFMYVTHPTEVFTKWDAVVSWDKWAMQWYQGIFPMQTWHYPQLIPTNYSLTYQFIGTTDVKYFSKYFANLIEFFIILIVFILGIKKKEIGYFLGVFFTSWLMYAFGSRGSGYVDSPVAFWGLLVISCLILAAQNKDEKKFLLLGAVFVSGAALTKQAGLWLVLVYPVLLVMRSNLTTKKSTSLILQSIAIMILLIAPWYIYKEIQIRTGIETSEIERVTSLVLDRSTFSQIVVSAGNLFIETLKNYYLPKKVTFILLLILLAFSYRDKFWARVCSLITIPFSIGWIFFFSYENRNLDMIIPMMGIGLGIGLQKLLELDLNSIKSFFQKKTPSSIIHFFSGVIQWIIKLVSSIRWWYFLLLVPIIFILPHWVSDNRLVNNSRVKQRFIGDYDVNEKLYSYKEEYGLDGKILTTYEYLGFLPELKDYYEYSLSNIPSFIDKFNDPEVGYALFNDHWWSEEVRDFVMGLINDDKIQLIFSYPTPSGNGTFYFVTTCHGVCK